MGFRENDDFYNAFIKQGPAINSGDCVAKPSLYNSYSYTNTKDERKNSSSEKFNSILESIRLFFGSVAVKKRTSSSTMSYTTQESYDTSSGYQSLDNSWELDDSYIKVAKFSEQDANGEFGHYGTYKEYKEMAQQQNLASEIKDIVVTNASIGSIKISDYLTLRTAGDVMNLSKCEPYGLKGCKLIVLVEDGPETLHLGNIFPEKGIMCTFEITLVLHIKKNPCRRIPFFNCKQNILHVQEVYELRKEKMYTSKKRRSSPIMPS